MERALGLTDIEAALGNHDDLPSAGELRRLMASLEVELFRHQLHVPTKCCAPRRHLAVVGQLLAHLLAERAQPPRLSLWKLPGVSTALGQP